MADDKPITGDKPKKELHEGEQRAQLEGAQRELCCWSHVEKERVTTAILAQSFVGVTLQSDGARR